MTALLIAWGIAAAIIGLGVLTMWIALWLDGSKTP